MIKLVAGVCKIEHSALGIPEVKAVLEHDKMQAIIDYTYYVYSPDSVYANLFLDKKRVEVFKKFVDEKGGYILFEKDPVVKDFILSFKDKSIPFYQRFYEGWKDEVNSYLTTLHSIDVRDANNNIDFDTKAKGLMYADKLLSLGKKYEQELIKEKQSNRSAHYSMLDRGDFSK